MLGAAIGRLLRDAADDRPAPSPIRGSPSAERLQHLRELLRRGDFGFEEAVRGATA